MTSHEEGRRDLRPAEAASGADVDRERAERLYGCGTPMPEKFDGTEWEPYSMRKHNGGTQSAWGVLRNDRTPLNTPCTPAVVKLQLRRQGEETAANQQAPRARELVATIQASALRLVQPLHSVRSLVDRVIVRLLPRAVVRSARFERHRGWIVWYLTTVLCIPFVLLVSPMVIAFCICTSPIWIAGGIVVAIRALVSSTKSTAATITEEYVHSPSPHHRVNGTRGVNGSSHHHHHHSPSSYRRSSLLPNDVADG